MAAKIGPWGGVGGRTRDIEHSPRRLVSVQVYGDNRQGVVKNLRFTYEDDHGESHDENQLGGDTTNEAPARVIELGHGHNYVKEMSGTYGPYEGVAQCITSISFVTNDGTEHPYGQANGDEFRIPVQEGQIVGFFGRGGQFIDAIGIYVLP